MDDALWLVKGWEQRLAKKGADFVNIYGDMAAGGRFVLQRHLAELAEVSSVGLALLRLLRIGVCKEAGGARSGSEAETLVEDAWSPCRLHGLLAEVVLTLVELCVRWMENAGQVGTICCALVAPPSDNPCEEHQRFAAMLREWRECDEIAGRGWRWCEAHLTLLPADESVWCHGAHQSLEGVTEWWWCPEVVSATDTCAAQDVSAHATRRLLMSVFASLNVPLNECALQPELGAALQFLDSLCTSSAGFFAHRIAVRHAALGRLHTVKAAALFHRATLFGCLALFGGSAKCGQNTGKDLLWVSREAFSFALRCLVSALTAVQIVVAHFNNSCVALRRRIRWALFGVKEPAWEKGDFTQSDALDDVGGSDAAFFVHPFAEPSENPLRVTHGVGLVATGKISEGTLVLRERPLLSASAQRQHPAVPAGQCSELSEVVAAAVGLLRRGGVMRRSDAATMEMADNILTGAILGQTARSPDTWAALHLLAATMPEATDNDHLPVNTFARDVGAVVRAWRDSSVLSCPVEDFRIRESESTVRARGFYPFASLINHSCLPNALRVFRELAGTDLPGEDDVVCIIALRDIERGEEITVTYLPSPLISESAKRLLNNFSCRCNFCKMHSAHLGGVVCPACKQLVYDGRQDGGDDDNNNDSNINHGRRSSHVQYLMAKRNVSPYTHSPDCIYAECGDHKAMERQLVQRFNEAFCSAWSEFVEYCDVGATVGDFQCSGWSREGPGGGNEAIENGESDQHARRAQKAVRRLLDIDMLACGLPATHYCRLRARLQCLAVSLSADVSLHDSARLVELAEDLLCDLEKLLPRNYPLLTGVRLHYCIARSRQTMFALGVDDLAINGYSADCCGGVRETAEMTRLPFVRDAAIRESLIQSFQEYYVCNGWRQGANGEDEVLQGFLRYYREELLLCGIDDVSHLNILSLMCDATQNNKT